MAKAWTLRARPVGMPTQGDFALIEQPRHPLEEGEIRVANRWLSVDPYMRGRMNEAASYITPFELDMPMEGSAIGAVVESRSDLLLTGVMVQHFSGWRDESVVRADEAQTLPELGAEPQAYLGLLGTTGMTAYFGLTAIAGIKAGDILFVSAAAGAVGSAVVQIAKAKGATVIGSAGGGEKCDWVRSLGADHVIDYRAEGTLVEKLRATAPKGIDVYFDNVGGDHLDAALAVANEHARFAICGMIHGYNAQEPTRMHNLLWIVGSQIRVQGFKIYDFLPRSQEFYADMAIMLEAGQLKSRETVRHGLDAMPSAFLELFTGGNIGKLLVKL